MASSGVVKVILSFYRDDEGSHSNGTEVVYRSIFLVFYRLFKTHGGTANKRYELYKRVLMGLTVN